jgi:hypothetical protein
MKQLVKQLESSEKLEKTAQEMRSFVKDAQRKLLEFEVLMSVNEIKQGKSHSYQNADELIKDLK